VGITEETDAVVIVVSEETGSISVVVRGELVQNLDPPVLRVVLRDILSGERDGLHKLSLGVEPGRGSRDAERRRESGGGSVRSAG
jgi:hypothetical protein